jgi:predicted permease
VHAAQGRVFTAADEASGEALIVLSDGLWHRAFGGDPSLIGQKITLMTSPPGPPGGPKTFTVIGVLPRAFRFSYPEEMEAWAIQPWSDVERYGGGGFQAVGRLQPGLSLKAANARAATIRTGLDRPGDRGARQVILLEPILEPIVGKARPPLLLLGGVALLLLLITCATVANALLVRVSERQREFAVRTSLGAGRRRLARQLLTEGLVLSIAGTTLGTLLAMLLPPVLRALVPPMVPRADEIGVNLSILAFAGGAVGIVTVVAALAPAWRGARVDLVSTLKQASGTASADRSTARWRRAFVGMQAAVATALLITSVLLLTSFWKLGQVPLGFDGTHVLTAEMRPLGEKYRPTYPPRVAGQPTRGPTPSAALVALQQDVLSRVRALPGVLEAGLTSAVPFRGVDFSLVLNRAGAGKNVGGNGRFVDAGYFSVMRMPPVRGRTFSENDTAVSPKVVVISESYAAKMFGTEDPLGKTIAYHEPVDVIGVVGDVRYQGFDKDPYPAIYFPRAQWPENLICLVARTAPAAGDLVPAIRAVVHDLDPTLPIMNFTTVDQIIRESVADRRFYTTSTAAFAAVALLLTAVGLVVIVARAVVERRRELAIRAALGAPAARLVGLVVRQGLMPVVVGSLCGLVAAYAGATVLGQFLFQVAPRAPLVYGGVAALIVSVSAVASLLPARRAIGAPLATTLRAE